MAIVPVAPHEFCHAPIVQTYYWSGTSMPFAGQIVVPSNLPLRSIMSNYLSANEGAMQGLVRHPFYPTIDESLRGVDATIPVADETVDDVMTRTAKSSGESAACSGGPSSYLHRSGSGSAGA